MKKGCSPRMAEGASCSSLSITHSLRIPLHIKRKGVTFLLAQSDNVVSAFKLSLTGVGGLVGKPASYDFINLAPPSGSVIIPPLTPDKYGQLKILLLHVINV